MSNILDQIKKTKITEIVNSQKAENIDYLKNKIQQQDKPRDFITAICNQHKNNKIAIIAEIKRSSPSKGIIRKNFNLTEIATMYNTGATCMSVLTDEIYFLGSLDYIQQVKKISTLPILRKDFIINEYQIYQSRAYGADAILLIASLLSKDQLYTFEQLAHNLGMSALVEVHDKSEIDKCHHLKTDLIGINNRNLKTFTIELKNSIVLSKYLKNKIIVAESGINTKEDIFQLQKCNINTFLIGESLMKKKNISVALNDLLN